MRIAPQILHPVRAKPERRTPYIGVVIPGNNGNVFGWAHPFKPRARGRELGGKRQVDQITGDGDMVRSFRLDVSSEGIENLAAVYSVTIAPPIEVAKRPFADQFTQLGRRQWRKMWIGQVCEPEGRHQAL